MSTDCCCPPLAQSACGCCEGLDALTPLPTANRPGLPALSYRIGTHGSFLETMKARLSSRDYPQLAPLSTREANDPAIALLDAWATVADVLTFYQERIANEGYLRTATERRSILELSRLVGYEPRPGVASSVFLAYTLDEKSENEVVIPAGSAAKSLPGPGETPQTFETSEELKARAKWNNLQPRMNRPQTGESIKAGNGDKMRIYLQGISTGLEPNDPLLIHLGDKPVFRRVQDIEVDARANRTLVVLQAEAEPQEAKEILTARVGVLEQVIGQLEKKPSQQPARGVNLQIDSKEQFSPGSEVLYKAVKAFAPRRGSVLAAAVANAQVSDESGIRVYALRKKASLFGHNMPIITKSLIFAFRTDVPNDDDGEPGNARTPALSNNEPDDTLRTLALDGEHNEIKPNDWIAVERQEDKLPIQPYAVISVTSQTLGGDQVGPLAFFSTEAPILAKATVLTLESPWRKDGASNSILRNTTVYFHSEELELAEEPVEGNVCHENTKQIELDGFYEGLEPGRWVIISGERYIKDTSGVHSSELAMISSVSQKEQTDLPGDNIHTFLKLATDLAYCFKRDTVTIYGNVVKATHGETRREVLGSGDGAKSLQSFVLKQPPLTFVSASKPSGVDSTLKVYVNDVRWHEADSLAGLAPTDRNFVTKTDDGGKTTVIFGNGREGARLPTGLENVRAGYRNGIGKPGNVKAGQITLLPSRPPEVTKVVNPLPATGGADRETRDQARKNTPLAVMALDRLVSVQDYEDFARIYGGVGKAKAVEISDGCRQVVHVTIAGADDIPIDESSELYQNLRQALLDYGDPYQPVKLEIRELMLIVISARIRILPDYQWEPVVTQVRAALLDAFSFERRELGQDVLLSEVISVMQAVHGVAYVDVDKLRGIPEKKEDPPDTGERRLLTPSEIANAVNGQLLGNGNKFDKEPLSRIVVNLAGRTKDKLVPAQLAFLSREVPQTLALNQIS